MITGFNTNVRHGGRLFHVQTEDSGRDHPHVISHLYYEGSILGSEKTEYGELVGSEDLRAEVRGLMERQHKKMVRQLKGGDFDEVITARLGDGGVSKEVETQEPPAAAESSSFGAEVGAQKPLDEVILEYLVEKARKRPQPPPACTRKKS